jgi:hypothetical protein
MYCPRCGQQLASDIRFCSRCGLPMQVVTEFLSHDGMPPPTQAAGGEARQPLECGTRLAVKLIFLSILLAPICFLVSFRADSPLPLFLPVTTFLAGSLWLLYSRLFSQALFMQNPRNRATQPHLAQPHAPALSSSHGVSGFAARAADTGEILAPPSVTDHTTRLLD